MHVGEHNSVCGDVDGHNLYVCMYVCVWSGIALCVWMGLTHCVCVCVDRRDTVCGEVCMWTGTTLCGGMCL